MKDRLSRRQFVIGGAAGTAGLVLGGLLPACGGPRPMPVTGEPVKVTTGPAVGEIEYVEPSATRFP